MDISIILYIEKSCLNKVLVALSFIFIVGFIAVNSSFILNIVFRTGDDKTKAYETLRYLFMSSWATIILWFVVTVLIYSIKQSGTPYKSEKHRANVRYILTLFLLWGGAFVLKAVMSFFSIKYSFDGS